jgi:hypothetical protein
MTEIRTLAIDIGGSHLKAGLLNDAGMIISEPMRVQTPKPAKPTVVIDALVEMAEQLRAFDRISIGFPGAVRLGKVQTAPNLGTEDWWRCPLDVIEAFRKASADAERCYHPRAWRNQWAGGGVCVDRGYRHGVRAV